MFALILCMGWGATANAAIKGDTNGDGIVDVYDAIYLHLYVTAVSPDTEGFYKAEYDINDDGKIDVADVVALYYIVKNQVKVTGIVVSGSTSAVTPNRAYAGQLVELSATITPSNATNDQLEWSSSNTNIATVDEYGLATFKDADGEVTFTAKATDGSGVSGKKTFYGNKVYFNDGWSTVYKDGKMAMDKGNVSEVCISDITGQLSIPNTVVKWSSDNKSVATVETSGSYVGKITAKAAGTATITADINGVVTKTLKVTVKGIEPTSISFSKDIIYTWMGKEVDPGMVVTPANADLSLIKFETEQSSVLGNSSWDAYQTDDYKRWYVEFNPLSGYPGSVSAQANQYIQQTITATLPNGKQASFILRSRFNMKIYDDIDLNSGRYFFGERSHIFWNKNEAEEKGVCAYWTDEYKYWHADMAISVGYFKRVPTTEYNITSDDPDIAISKHSNGEVYVLTKKNFVTHKLVKLTITVGHQKYYQTMEINYK